MKKVSKILEYAILKIFFFSVEESLNPWTRLLGHTVEMTFISEKIVKNTRVRNFANISSLVWMKP